MEENELPQISELPRVTEQPVSKESSPQKEEMQDRIDQLKKDLAEML